ncbi:AMP-binding protein [Mycolicibacterium mageritense]|nr:AMP-binding protein [Mycolicibacterium mageritense]MBN3454836.1 AMP-binding protein [Mycobacterium sp. DSM 3803]MCC9179727.1 AMP-binding protein [Mycolicibacterium mageritense]TXI61411.1 MAG: acyl-CoA synthetase [Mycolicibacterium mageritense]CDO22940.1 acyl-CoA synthetase [Mycolicibacterium mageritense DSM 44476 = CIP 104973]BDY28812.1 Putative fatty-acid--CoA ligase FadD21 [Mycolicibacterium mageritense]
MSSQSSILSMLHGRASMRPDDVAFTFTDYDRDPAGIAETLTWSQLSRQTMNVAREIRLHGEVGDRAVILAPQGLDYILAFLGAMQAGLIAVPLPLPHRGSSHDRVSAVVADTKPAVVLTTSAVAQDVGDYVDQSEMETAPKIVAVDVLNLEAQGGPELVTAEFPSTAYLQYSSGSTRLPTGVMISHRNLQANFEQLMRGLFADSGVKSSAEKTIVSWLPFYHDMGLVLGVCAPILGGFPAALTSPVAFLEKPARWVRALAENPVAFSAAPNFAFDLAARKTKDADLAGLDLGGVQGIINGAERVEPATLERFADRFAHFNFRDHMLRPSYGLAEATVFVATGVWSEASELDRFEVDALAQGLVRRSRSGSALVRYRLPQSPSVRIVDVDTNRECPPDVVGEIWVHGDNVSVGYWSRSPEEQQCFGATLADPTPGTATGPWLKTGDLGFVSDGDLFIVGRIKDLLIIRGRNHYPEDIEATVQQITGGRVAAIAVPVNSTEKLVTVVEVKKRGGSAVDAGRWLSAVKSDVTSAISNAHGLNVGDLVLVPPGSIPTTTSGKIRRAACAEQYRQDEFVRLDA